MFNENLHGLHTCKHMEKLNFFFFYFFSKPFVSFDRTFLLKPWPLRCQDTWVKILIKGRDLRPGSYFVWLFNHFFLSFFQRHFFVLPFATIGENSWSVQGQSREEQVFASRCSPGSSRKWWFAVPHLCFIQCSLLHLDGYVKIGAGFYSKNKCTIQLRPSKVSVKVHTTEQAA